MGRHGQGPGVTGAQQLSDQDKHLSDLNTLRISRCQVFISPRRSHLAQVE